MFKDLTIKHMQEHAIQEAKSGKESCGLVIQQDWHQSYLPCENVAEGVGSEFQIDNEVVEEYLDNGLVAVIHSHPYPFDAAPSGADMECQIDMDVVWGIVPVGEGGDAGKPFFWGGDTPIPELIGREYRHGVTDCYTVVRDWYQINHSIELPNKARWHQWYTLDDGPDFYIENYQQAGFVDIDFSTADIGDVLLMQIGSEVISHAAVITQLGIMLHHPGGDKPYDPTKLSREEPIARWQKYIRKVVRYAG